MSPREPSAVGGAGRGAAAGPGASATLGAGASAGAGRGMGGPAGGAYGQLMVNDLIPWVDSHFRTLPDKDHRGMAGLSMGGGQTASVTMVNRSEERRVGKEGRYR